MATLKRLFQTLGCIHVLRYSSRGDRLWGWIAEKAEPRFGAFPRLGALLPDWVKLPAPHAQLLPPFMNVVLIQHLNLPTASGYGTFEGWILSRKGRKKKQPLNFVNISDLFLAN